ncbi:MAG: Type secretory pathway, component PulK, partial [Phycisphaerales bacterium]|nr:Type secretory pathway, component PulK [Phycisphaerales bacterium]
NPITLDSVFAEDTDTSDDAPATPEDREFIGRFAPTASDLGAAIEGESTSVTANSLIDSHRTEAADTWAGYDVLITGGAGRPQVRSVVASDPTTGTLQLAPTPAGNPALPPGSRYALHANRYAWAARLFDYLDVLAPRGDYLPGANPADYSYPDPADGKFRPILPAPVSVQHTRSTIAPALAIEGQININTAPWRVLATVPFFDSNADRMDFRLETPDPMARGLPTLQPNNLPDNEELARAIVSWRQAHGPFRNLFDLYRVPAFVQANRLAVQLSGRAIPNDFQQRFFLLARVANVLTTRSDSFTCYVLVQGWRGVGTASPELVVQRRRAFMVDRSGAAAVAPDLAVRSFYNP